MKTSSDKEIIDLLASSSFESLSAKDRAFVLAEMTADEYAFQRQLILTSKETRAPAKGLPTSTLSDIKAKLGGQLHKEKTLVDKVISAQLPLWLVTLLGVLGYGLVQYMQGNTKQSAAPAIAAEQIVVRDTLTIYKIDTLYVEVPSAPKVVIKEIIKIVEVPTVLNEQVILLANLEMPIASDHTAYHSELETEELVAGRPGRSIDEEVELMELLDIQ